MNIVEKLNRLTSEDKRQILEAKDADVVKDILAKNDIDFNSFKSNSTNRELSDDELENVNGGLDLNPIIQNIIKSIVDKIKDNIID